MVKANEMVFILNIIEDKLSEDLSARFKVLKFQTRVFFFRKYCDKITFGQRMGYFQQFLIVN